MDAEATHDDRALVGRKDGEPGAKVSGDYKGAASLREVANLTRGWRSVVQEQHGDVILTCMDGVPRSPGTWGREGKSGGWSRTKKWAAMETPVSWKRNPWGSRFFVEGGCSQGVLPLPPPRCPPITWGLVRYADSRVPPQIYRIAWVGPSNRHCHQLSPDFDRGSSVRPTGL